MVDTAGRTTGILTVQDILDQLLDASPNSNPTRLTRTARGPAV